MPEVQKQEPRCPGEARRESGDCYDNLLIYAWWVNFTAGENLFTEGHLAQITFGESVSSRLQSSPFFRWMEVGPYLLSGDEKMDYLHATKSSKHWASNGACFCPYWVAL
jgi:hypothetical protein